MIHYWLSNQILNLPQNYQLGQKGYFILYFLSYDFWLFHFREKFIKLIFREYIE